MTREQGACTIYRSWAVGTVNSALVTTSCTLSLLGTLLIVITYVIWKDTRTTSRGILVCLSIADFFVACGNLIGLWSVKQNSSDVCVTQSFVTSTANLMSYMWSACLAVYLYIALVKRRQTTAEKLVPLFHTVSWLPATLINITALLTGALGNTADALTGGWCWIRYVKGGHHRGQEILWMLVDGQIWLLAACFINVVLYAPIKLKMGKEIRRQCLISNRHDMIKAAKTADRKLMLMPMLFVLVRMWGSIRFLLFLLNVLPDEDGANELNTGHKLLLTLQGVGDSAQGFVNCILFCFFTPKVFNHLKNVAKDVFRHCWYRRYASPVTSFNYKSTVGCKNDESTILGEHTSLMSTTDQGEESAIEGEQTSLMDSDHYCTKTYGTT